MASRDRQGQMVRAVVAILYGHNNGLPSREVIKRVEAILPPTEAEQTTVPSSPGSRRYEKDIGLATASAVKAGWMVKDRGNWRVTNRGRKAITTFLNPEALMREADRLAAVGVEAVVLEVQESTIEHSKDIVPKENQSLNAFEMERNASRQEVWRHFSKVRRFAPAIVGGVAAALVLAIVGSYVTATPTQSAFDPTASHNVPTQSSHPAPDPTVAPDPTTTLATPTTVATTSPPPLTTPAGDFACTQFPCSYRAVPTVDWSTWHATTSVWVEAFLVARNDCSGATNDLVQSLFDAGNSAPAPSGSSIAQDLIVMGADVKGIVVSGSACFPDQQTFFTDDLNTLNSDLAALGQPGFPAN